MSASPEIQVISLIAQQISETIKKDSDLSRLASEMTGMGLRMQWLGMEVPPDHAGPEIQDTGNHLYKLGCDLQGIALQRMKA